MHYSGQAARDRPAPPTLTADTAGFGVPVIGLEPQPKLRQVGHGVVRSNAVLHQIALSYALIAQPDRPEDPSNFRAGFEKVDTARARAEQTEQPVWLLQRLQYARYPTLWEAVVTIAMEPGETPNAAEFLTRHINHVMINTVDSRRRGTETSIPTLDGAVKTGDAHHAELDIDGLATSALVIDTDPDIAGWAACNGDALVLVALPRAVVAHIERNLVTVLRPDLGETPSVPDLACLPSEPSQRPARETRVAGVPRFPPPPRLCGIAGDGALPGAARSSGLRLEVDANADQNHRGYDCDRDVARVRLRRGAPARRPPPKLTTRRHPNGKRSASSDAE
jgi:hypothetical protein